MNPLITNAIFAANTVAEQIAQAKLGLAPGVTDPILIKAESLAEELVHHLQSHPEATYAAPTPAPSVAGSAAIAKVATVLAFGLLLAGLATGCASPSKAHVVRVVGTGDRLGLTQDPATGMYQLGFLRAQTEVITVPVVFTNGEFRVAPVLSRYEVNGHSAIFGNVALTSTLATGSNAVNSQVGGNYPPINAGTGTGNELQYPLTISTTTNTTAPSTLPSNAAPAK